MKSPSEPSEADQRLLWWLYLGGICAITWPVAVVTAATLIVAQPYKAQFLAFMLFSPMGWMLPAAFWWLMGIPALFARSAPPRK